MIIRVTLTAMVKVTMFIVPISVGRRVGGISRRRKRLVVVSNHSLSYCTVSPLWRGMHVMFMDLLHCQVSPFAKPFFMFKACVVDILLHLLAVGFICPNSCTITVSGAVTGEKVRIAPLLGDTVLYNFSFLTLLSPREGCRT